MDNELLLYDRIEVIKATNQKYDLEHNAYLSFSGGKDSTILHHLIDMALPNNKIPRVFIDTGIEYKLIREFVMKLASKDDRFVIIKPSVPVIPMLKEYGYPFKSKQHAHDLMIYQTGGMTTTVKKYLGVEQGNNIIKCPKKLQYQFTEDFKIKISDNCCRKMKKEPAHRYEKESGKSIVLTGMRQAEGGQRASIKGCAITDKDGNLKKFHPLLVVSDEWENWYVEREREFSTCTAILPTIQLQKNGVCRVSIQP